MLPGFDGLEVCRRIQRDRPVPVLMLTARDSETDLLVGLAVGADDYLTKPFSPRELVARVHAILRRVGRSSEAAAAADPATRVLRLGHGALPPATPRGAPHGHPPPPAPAPRVLRLGKVALEPATRRATLDGEPIHLTPTEFDILALLGDKPGVVFTREQLLADIWGYRDGFGARTVDSHVQALRRKLGAGVIRTVHGVGYAAGDDELSPQANPEVRGVPGKNSL